MLSIKDIYTCKDLNDALSFLKENPYYLPLAAGTDVVPMLRDKKIRDVSFLNLQNVDALKQIYLDASHVLHIGAMVTHEQISVHPLILKYLPALAMACSVVGSPQIRARATIGGNICHASPAADTAAVLAAACACAVLVKNNDTQRVILLEKFWLGPGKTCLQDGELLKEIMIVLPENGYQGKYYKIGGRSALTIAIASSAVLYDGQNWRISAGSISAVVKRLPLVEACLNQGTEIKKIELEALLRLCTSPISDIRASREYRLKAAAGLLWQAWYEISNDML